jgi:hypothetical protein
MKITPVADKEQYSYGKGTVIILRENPGQIVLQPNGDKHFLQVVEAAYNAKSKNAPLTYKNSFVLKRGPYIVSAALDEDSKNEPLKLQGRFIDLFDTELPVISEKVIAVNTQSLLYDLDKIVGNEPAVLAGATRVYDEKIAANSYSFTTKSPDNTENVMRIFLPSKPAKVTALDISGKAVKADYQWDAASKTVLLKYTNQSNGINVAIAY